MAPGFPINVSYSSIAIKEGAENDRPENYGTENKEPNAGKKQEIKCRTWIWRTTWHDMKMKDLQMEDLKIQDLKMKDQNEVIQI